MHLMALAAAGVFVVGRYEDVWWESETALSIKERTLAPFVDKVKTAWPRPPPSVCRTVNSTGESAG